MHIGFVVIVQMHVARTVDVAQQIVERLRTSSPRVIKVHVVATVS